MLTTKAFRAGRSFAGAALLAAASFGIPQIPPAEGTLGAAVAGLTPSPESLVIATDPHLKALPGKADVPRSLTGVAATFGRKVARFGSVEALAPATMVLLNGRPANANVFGTLSSGDALRIFLGQLDESQIAALTSSRGLGRNELRTRTQSLLFDTVVLPGGSALVVDLAKEGSPPPNAPTDLSAKMGGARLRLGQLTDVFFHSPDGQGIGSHVVPGKFYLMRSDRSPDGTVFGVPAREVVPTRAKPGGLDFALPALAREVDLGGIRTVGEVVAAVCAATRLELYADAHFAGKPLAIAGNRRQAPAGDILRALAYGLTGTYRRVGPAYVLTNDAMGLGAKAEAWRRFELDARRTLDRYLAEADGAARARLAGAPLAPFGDEALTPEQKKNAKGGNPFFLSRVDTTLSELTGAQRETARRNAPRFSGNPEDTLARGVVLVNRPTLEVIVPGFDAPITVPAAANFVARYALPPEADTPTTEVPKGEKAPPLVGSVRTAVLDATEIASKGLAGSLKRAGFNQASLDITGAETAAERKALRGFAAEARTLGLSVGVNVSPLKGRADAADRDLSLLGEAVPTAGKQSEPTEWVYLDPRSSAARAQAAALLRTIAPLGPVAAIYVDDTVPPGYAPVSGTDAPALGYSLDARLAFLRKQSIDPLDLPPAYPMNLAADLSLPQYDDPTREVDRLSVETWGAARRTTNARFLTAFLDELTKGVPRAKTFVSQRRAPLDGYWYGGWSQGKPLPGEAGLPSPPVLVQIDANYWPSPASLSRGVGEAVTERRAQGVVVDFRGLRTVTTFLEGLGSGVKEFGK